MSRYGSFAALGALALCVTAPVSAADPGHDFTGKWTLDRGASRIQELDVAVEPEFTVLQQDASIHCSNNANYALDGSETKYRSGELVFSTAVKWEGAALLINTLVSGPTNYTLMDRWRLSPEHKTLTITRQVIRGTQQTEGVLVYRGEGWVPPVSAPSTAAVSVEGPRPFLVRPNAEGTRAVESDVTVLAGTHIALALLNAVDTKHTKEGDRIYLETIYPISAGGRIAIPPGSFVNGTVAKSKPAGRGKSKGELFIRFDSLTLPSGATRDFRSRLSSAEGTKVDREEGKVSGERDTGRDVGKVAGTTGMGASLGGLVGHASGSALKGAGIGAAAGAAAGVGMILLKKGPEATLRQGTTMEMILDRDISFSSAELRW